MSVKVYSVDQMRRIDKETIEEYGIDGILLMENAALAIKNEIIKLENINKNRALIVCGRGNNGGDGFALARQLLGIFESVKIAFIDDVSKLFGDCKTNYEIAKKLSIDIISDFEKITEYAKSSDIIVDALYGFGFRAPLSQSDEQLVRLINESDAYVLSVDVPSGVCADTGECACAVCADKTVTFTGYKPAQLMFPAAGFCGEVCIADIGIPPAVINKYEADETIGLNFVSTNMAERKRNSHKGNCGKAFIVGGSRGMSGAVCMSAGAALKSGAGLVTVGLPVGINEIFEKKVTEAMSIALCEQENGIISKDAIDEILAFAQKCDTLVIGPGMGRDESVTYILRECLKNYDKNIIIDADALYALSLDTSVLENTNANVIITPHHAEMGRLILQSPEYVEKNAIKCAKDFANKYDITVVLKGAYTVIASGTKAYINNSAGNQGMATGGSGDVLCGVIASLLHSNEKADVASACAVYIHALAGDMAKQKFGMTSMVAGDILDMLPDAFCKIYKEK